MSSLIEPLEPAGPEDIALAGLRDSVRILDKRVRRGESQRRWLWLMIAALLVAIIALLVLYADVIMGRSNSRQYYNGQLHDLACGLVQFTPPGDELGDQLRAQYHCPAYSPPRRGQTPHTSLPHSSTAPSGQSNALGAPSTSPTATRPSATRVPDLTSGDSRTAQRPVSQTGTPTPQPVARRSAPPSPQTRTRTVSPSPGIVPGLLCPIARTPLLCDTENP